MKTIEAFIKEIEGSVALQEELKAIKDEDAFAAFLKKYDVEGSVEDFAKAMQAKTQSGVELSDEELDNVAGGSFKSLWKALKDFFRGFG